MNFSYLDKPITECTDQELISWYVMFCNGADLNNPRDKKELVEFRNEIPNRDYKFKEEIEYIDSVL